MKKLLFIALAFVSTSIFGQTTGNTELTVSIAKTCSITVGQATVAIAMNTPTHFTGGSASGKLTDHLQISSSAAYTVAVKASAANFTKDDLATDLGVSNISVVATDAGNDISTYQSTLSTASPLTVAVLSTTDQNVVTTTGGDLNRGYDVDYQISAANAVNFLDRTGEHKTTITYTITTP